MHRDGAFVLNDEHRRYGHTSNHTHLLTDNTYTYTHAFTHTHNTETATVCSRLWRT